MSDLPVGDPAAVASGLARDAERLASARDELAGLVGTAESDGGLIQVTVGPEGLRDLVIEPKAMRLPSADLAATIVSLAQDATDDLARVRNDTLAELGVSVPGVDIEQSRAKLAELEALARSGDGDMIAVYERFRRQIGL